MTNSYWLKISIDVREFPAQYWKNIYCTLCSKPNSTQTLKKLYRLMMISSHLKCCLFSLSLIDSQFVLEYKQWGLVSGFCNEPKGLRFFLSMLYSKGRTTFYVGLLFDMVVCDRNFQGNFLCVLLLHLLSLSHCALQRKGRWESNINV